MATDYYSLEVRVNVAGFPMANVFHYKIVDPSVSNEYLVAASLINELTVGAGITSWFARYQRLMSVDCYISNVLAKRIKVLGGNTAELILQEDSRPGIRTGNVIASQVAAAIIWVQTTEEGTTGRNFIPGISEDDLENGRFTDDFQEAIDNFITKHLAGFTVSGGVFLPVIFQRETSTGLDITNGYLSPKPGTIRNREKPL